MRDFFPAAYKFLKHLVFIRNPRLVRRILSGYANTLFLRRDMLRSVELAITYGCQAHCHKCYAANLKRKDESYLSLDEIRGLVAQAKQLGLIHVNITGGEPTLRDDLVDVVRACSPEDIMVSIVTNSLAMTREKLAALRKAGLNTIQISLDSADPVTHDRLRGVPGCYDSVMQTAAWARELGIILCFSTVLSTEPETGEKAMWDLLHVCERERAFLLICDSAAVGGWESQDAKMFGLEERNKALSTLLRHPWARHHALYNFRVRPGCPAGVEKIYITAYGDATPCDLVHDAFGNVRREPLRDIWDRMRSDPLYAAKHADCVRYLDEFKTRERP